MREYKFRGKRIDNGEWITGCLIQDNYGVFILKIGSYLDNMKRVYPETVEQIIEESEILKEEKRFQEILKYSVKIDELEKRKECERVNG